MPTGTELPPRRPALMSGGTMRRPAPLSIEEEEVRRLKQEEGVINLDGALASLLRECPVTWLRAIVRTLGVRPGQRSLITAITMALRQPHVLAHTINSLSDEARTTLTLLVQGGGWHYHDILTAYVGSDDGDGFQWDFYPPQSPLGELRVHGLAFVGTAHLQEVWLKVVVVPHDIRAGLHHLLGSTPDPAFGPPPAPGLPLVLHWANFCYEMLGTSAVIPKSVLVAYLNSLAERGAPPPRVVAAWDDLDDLHHFIVDMLPSIRTLNDLRPVHLRAWMESLVRGLPTQRLPTQVTQEMIFHINGLLTTAAGMGMLSLTRLTELRTSLALRPSEPLESLSPRGEARAERPASSTWELKGVRDHQGIAQTGVISPGLQEYMQQFSDDEVRLVLAWYHAFGQDWNRLRRATVSVPAGPAKARLAARLQRYDPVLLTLLIESIIDPDAIAIATEWFYTGTFAVHEE